MIPTEYLNTPQAARLVGLSPRTLEKLRVQGNGPEYRKLNRAVRYARHDLEKWLDQGRRRSTSDPGPGAK